MKKRTASKSIKSAPIFMNQKIINNNHVFIFAVCGRSSSTALQRILNSSNEICIWGEQHHIIDDLIKIIHQLDYFMEDEHVCRQIQIFISSFRERYHFLPYANAIGNLLEFKKSLIEALCKNLILPDSKIKRFGFKCIRLKDKATLQGLTEIFPNSQFIFLFRNPIDQWPSINLIKWWNYSYKLQDFLREYQRISTILLEFISLNKESILLENSGIQEPEILQKVLNKLNIKEVDQEVVKRKVLSLGDIPYPKQKYAKIIKEHSAYANYLALKELQISQ